MTKEAQREAAHKAAEAALSDMRKQLPDVTEGYDIDELPDGDLRITCGHDVVLYVDGEGEVYYTRELETIDVQRDWYRAMGERR